MAAPMTSTFLEELKKHKVAELKKLLRDRELPETGKKDELLARLAAYLDAHPEDELISTESDDEVEDEVEDEVGDEIGDDAILDESEDAVQDDSIGESNTEEEVADADATNGPDTTKDKKPSEAVMEKEEKKEDGKTLKLSEIGNSDELQKKAERAKKFSVPLNLTDEERQKARSDRFNVNKSAAVTGSEDDRKKLRAVRFGGEADAPGMTKEELESRIAKRRARFGVVEVDVAKGKNKNLKRADSTEDNDQALKKRKERFGTSSAIVSSADNDGSLKRRRERFATSENLAAVKPAPVEDVKILTEAERKKKRGERFESGA